jgi:acetylornithine deacetylase
MARWAAAALSVAESKKSSPDDPGTCMNIGIVDGGSKSNVIAGGAFVHWSARLRPGESNDAFLEEIRACTSPGDKVSWEVPFKGEPLPASGQDDQSASKFCAANDLPLAEPVDFWTEASLFSAAGLPAIVLGPGDIAQAHAANEWVALAQLRRASELYSGVIKQNG